MESSKSWVWATVFLLPLLSSCQAHQSPKFTLHYTSTIRAFSQGGIKEALAYFESEAREAEKKAETSLSPQQHLETATIAYTEASRAARLSGQLQKAVTYGEKAVENAYKIKGSVWSAPGMSFKEDMLPGLKVRAIIQLVSAYRSVKKFDNVRGILEKGLEIVNALSPNTNYRDIHESLLYMELGAEFMRQADYQKAIGALTRSVSLEEGLASRVPRRTRIGQRTMFLNSLVALAGAHRQVGQLEDALELYERALATAGMSKFKYAFRSDLYEGIGDVYFRQREYALAMENFNRALAVAANRGSPTAVSSVNRRIGDVLRQTGEPASAISYYQRSIQQIESIRSLLDSEEYRQSYFEGALGAYVRMVESLLESGRQEEAFNYSERARSRVFLDVLGSRVQISRAKAGLMEEEKALQERMAGLKAMAAVVQDEAERESLRKEVENAETAYKSFLARVRKEGREQASLMTVEPLGLKDVQELLEPAQTLIEYFVTPEKTFLWIVGKNQFRALTIPIPQTDLTRKISSLRRSILELRSLDQYQRQARELYELLIQPALPYVQGKELIIIPHDVLHYLPFHALVGPDGRYLIEKYPIYYLSSASLLQFTTAKRKAKGDRVLAFGNPDLGDPQKDLQFAELEASEVGKLYPQSTVLMRKEATEEKSKALSPHHDILHFAAHAELKEDDPLSSAILLARNGKEDGRLEVREVFGMDLKANLVVLSACETGLGKLSTGDELVGLTRAFIYAGTPSVVASLWKVEDSSTAALMTSFYKNLRTMSKVEALRQAQLELIRGGKQSDLLARRGVGGIGKLGEMPETKPQSPRPGPVSVSTSHPYFWAPFILVGDGK